jgi:hypothetical protein
MAARRTVAPDIAGCCLFLFAATLSFAVLRAPYIHKHAPEIARDIAIYGGLLLACVSVAMGLFQRRAWALIPGLVLLAAGFGASVLNWHMPETGQLPAGVLGATGVVLLLARADEFKNGGPGSDGDGDGDDEPVDEKAAPARPGPDDDSDAP